MIDTPQRDRLRLAGRRYMYYMYFAWTSCVIPMIGRASNVTHAVGGGVQLLTPREILVPTSLRVTMQNSIRIPLPTLDFGIYLAYLIRRLRYR